MDQRIAQLSEQVDELTTNDPQQPPPAAPLSSPSNAASRRSTISASRLGGPGTATSANSPPTGSSSSSWSGRASTVQTPSPLRRASSATSSSSSSPSTATTQPAPLPAAAALPASGSPDLMLIAIHELNQAREEMKSVTYALSMAQAASRVSFDEQSATHAPFRFAGHGLTATPSTGATPQTGFGTPSNENVRLRSTGKRRLALRQRLSRRTSPTLAQLLASLDGETLLAAKQALRQTGGNSGVRARRRPLAQQLQAAPAGRTLEQLLQSRFAAVHSPRSPSSPAWQSSPTGNA